MAKRTNILALAILSLLTERPMHPYEMSSIMRQREINSIMKVSQSSLYTSIETLSREGLIQPIEVQREGRYPERTVYTTTKAGQAELTDWLRVLLRKPMKEYSQFAVALAFLSYLQPSEVIELLHEHRHSLQEEKDTILAMLDRGQELGLDRIFTIEDRYMLKLLEARHSFIEQFLQEISDGILTEMHNGIQMWKVTRPDLAMLGSDAEEHDIQ